MRNPEAFVRKEPCLTFTLNKFFLWKMNFRMPAPEGFSSMCVSLPWLLPSPTFTVMIQGHVRVLARFGPFPGKIPAKNPPLKRKGETRNKFLFDNNKVLFSLRLKWPTGKLQRRHLSVIWGSSCTVVFPWSDDKTRWYLWKTLWF